MDSPIVAIFIAGIISAAATDYLVSSRVKNNEFNGYHCAPLTKHKTLDSAIKQVEINQASSAALIRG